MGDMVTNDVVEGWGRLFDDTVRALIRREGVEDLMGWLAKTDMYTAPASSRYHGAYEGGLLEHLLDVHAEMRRLNDAYGFGFTEESMAVVAGRGDQLPHGTVRRDHLQQRVGGLRAVPAGVGAPRGRRGQHLQGRVG